MKKWRRRLSVLIVILGMVCVCYPWLSNWLYDNRVDSEVRHYNETVLSDREEANEKKLDMLWQQAMQYNYELTQSRVDLGEPFLQSENMDEMEYEHLLSIDDSGIMCFIEIPKIDVYLPVYHGTAPETLEKGAGHLKGSSLPVGGEDTHAVISAHTGINSSKMFSDLTSLSTGDIFYIHVLNQILAYEVFDIKVILPEDTKKLSIRAGEDLISLITCTPYGVNTHRLVVTGERTCYVDNITKIEKDKMLHTESEWMKSYKKAIFIGMIGAVNVIILKSCIFYKSRKKQETRF